MSVSRQPAGARAPRGANLRRGLALLALVPTSLAAISGGVALADDVTNNVTTPGKVVSTTVGTPATVTFTLVATDKTQTQDDAQGCNATTSAPVTLTASGTGVTVDHDTAVAGVQSSRIVTSCSSWAFTFTSSTTGDKAITVATSGGANKSTYNVSGAAFTLRVAAATPTAAATSLSLAPATGAYDAASANLVATLSSGSTAVTGKSVSFTVGGTTVGSATTQPNGVATLTYPLNKAVAAGSHVTGASWSGDGSFASSNSAPSTLTVFKADQSVTFGSLGGKTFGDAPFAVSASASSGLPVAFASTTTDVCTVVASTVTIAAAGPCSLTASQAGNSNYNPASAVVQAFEVAKASQTISLSLSRDSATFRDGETTTVTANATSGLPVALSAVGPCALNGTTLTITGGGTCTVTGTQVGNGNYLPAENATATLNVAKANQEITFAQPAPKTFGDSTFTLDGNADSGLPVSYTASPANVCTVSGSTVTLGDAGECIVTANQAGNDDFNSAAALARTFTVAKAAQAITFGALGNKTFGDAAFPVSASALGGPVSFAAAAGTCTVADGTVTITGAGTCTITASQLGSTNYLAADDVVRSFTIAKADQTITFPALGDKAYGDLPVTVGAMTNSGLPVSFGSDTPTVCTVSGTEVKLASAGTCTITVSQPGDENWNAASNRAQSFTVAPAALTVTAPSLTREIGAANPELAPAYSGFVNGEGPARLTAPATCTTTATVASPVGIYPVTCSGAQSGNYTTTYVGGSLTVVYRYSGLLQPINVDRSSAFKSGSTVPVKFQVLGAGDVVQDANDIRATIKVTKLGSATATAVTEDVVTASGDAGNTFRWDPSGKQYIYNLSTKTWAMGEGRYRVDVLDAAGKVLTTGEFQVKK